MSGTGDKIRSQLAALVERGNLLWMAMQYETHPDEFERMAKKQLGDEARKYLDGLPSFKDKYQDWYSESQAAVKTLLPLRYADFVGYYEKPRNRKLLTMENYVISDYLQDLSRGDYAKPSAAFSQLRQQLNVLKSALSKLDSVLFDIKNLVLGDVLGSELEAASTLCSQNFVRAAGAMAGVVLERHLSQVAENHAITLRKKNPTIGDYSAALKEADVLDIATWRFISHLSDVRNACDHARKTEPSKEQVQDLIAGVEKVTKTLI